MSNKVEWDNSYDNRDNFVFYPHEEVVRFMSKYIRKRIGLCEFKNIAFNSTNTRILDLGCGIGRHVMYCHDMGLDAFGIDLSDSAISFAHEWARQHEITNYNNKILQGDVRQLPWEHNFFSYAISHGVLDSMPFDIARAACIELGRVMTPEGLFYCDLVSGDDSRHAREFSGEEIVTSVHEKGTTQLYYNFNKINELIQGVFMIEECLLGRREDVLNGNYTSRYFLVLKKI